MIFIKYFITLPLNVKDNFIDLTEETFKTKALRKHAYSNI